MLSPETCERIVSHTTQFWNDHVQTKQFTDLASGKEIGHRIADYVDDQTVAYLKVDSEITVKNELDSSGHVIKRSMGDLWVYSNDMYNPINIKSGITTNGNPNVVSLAKLVTRLIKHEIDSYYLLIVKTPQDPDLITFTTPKVFLIDLLDHLDFVNYDAGPGQVMLKEVELYTWLSANNSPTTLNLTQKVQKCMEIMEDGHERLLRNRELKLNIFRAGLASFEEGVINQEGLNFG